LGDNSQTDRSSPVQTVAGGTDWKQVSCGSHHSAGIKDDGSLWLWGSNAQGQLGDNTTTRRSSPVQTVAGGTWKLVSCGNYHTAAIKNDGTLWTWGNNVQGQLGTGSGSTVSSPVQTVAAGTDWKQVFCGPQNNTAAIKIDGTLWTWGSNSAGQLGDNSLSSSRSSPVQTVAYGSNWKQVSLGQAHAAATTFRES
jgi:alpha-tubulin suppressor-like RCC1 family protein